MMEEQEKVLCKKCANKTNHKVLYRHEVDLNDEEWDISEQNVYEVVECAGCGEISFLIMRSSSEDLNERGGYDVTVETYPIRREGIKGLDNLAGVPANVRFIYKEMLEALENDQPILAGMGIRALIEAVCQDKEAEGKNLFAKIDSLVNKGVLTADAAGILHKLRTLGNAAAHQTEKANIQQLKLASDVVGSLLQNVYIFPRLAEIKYK